jgi:hypothetical protein
MLNIGVIHGVRFYSHIPVIDRQDSGPAPHALNGLEDTGSGPSRAAEHISYL